MNVKVRTKGSVAKFTVDCVNNEQHTFVVNFDGTVLNSYHNAEQDEVIVALGGDLHPCGKALKIFEAALEVYKAETGVADFSAAKYYTRSGWGTPRGCSCPRRGYGIAHINSMQHVLAEYNLTDNNRTARTLLNWLRRNSEGSQVFKNFAELIASYPSFEVPEYSYPNNRYSNSMNLANFMLTPSFMEAGLTIFDNNPNIVYKLRAEKGIKVDWIKKVAENLKRSTVRKIKNINQESFINSLVGARNMDPVKVASFINAGIYANIYTYIKNNATPEQALTVYKATNGSSTLASMLREGHSIPGAVRSVSA